MKSQAFILCIMALFIVACGLACQNPNYRYEVTAGQQGQTTVNRVPLTPEEQASRQREQQVRAALAQPPQPPPPPPEPDLATLESLWPKLSPADKAAVLELAKRSAEQQK